LKPLLQCTR